MNSIAAATSAEALRALLRERFPAAHAPAKAGDGAPVETGCAELDRIGLVKGGVTEVVQANPSAGGALLLGQLIEGAAAGGRPLALIDARDSFDPAEFPAQVLRRLLWVRPTTAAEALKAADLLLRDGNLPLVVIDMALSPGGELRRVPQSSWYRLRGLAGEGAAALIAITPAETVPAPHLRLRLQGGFTLAAFEHPRGDLRPGVQVTRSAHAPLTMSA